MHLKAGGRQSSTSGPNGLGKEIKLLFGDGDNVAHPSVGR